MSALENGNGVKHEGRSLAGNRAITPGGHVGSLNADSMRTALILHLQRIGLSQVSCAFKISK